MAFSMQAALKLQELVELEELFFQLTEEDRLEALTMMFATIREDPRGAVRPVQQLHDDFHDRKPQPQGHGCQEGATVVTLLLPFSVEEAGLSAPGNLGRYSEALVELGLRGSDPTWLECSKMLQEFAVLFWRSTRHLGSGRDIEKLDLTSEEKFLAWIMARKEVFRARLSGAVEARLSRLHTEQWTSVDLWEKN